MRHALPLLFLGLGLLLSRPWEVAAQSAATATVSGQVLLDDGKPAVGYTVVVSSTDYVSPAPAGTAVTDAAGRYSVAITPAPAADLFGEGTAPADTHFSVTVRIGDGLYLSPAVRQVSLTPDGGVTGVNFRVTVGPQITVRVHDALTGLPVPGMVVGDNWPGGGPTLGVTDARGEAVFRLKSLNADLTLEAPSGTTPTVQAAPDYSFYKQIGETQVQDVTWDVRTYPVPLPTTSLWHGVVLGMDGHPVKGVTVHILRRQNQGPDKETVLRTDGKGRFSGVLPPLGPEEYFPGAGAAKMVAVLAERGVQTALLVPTPDETWNGMTLRLADAPLASYAGTVVDAQGRPEAGVPVSCRGELAAAYVGLSRNAIGGVTDGMGHFIIPGLPAGRYALTFGGGPFGVTTVPASKAGYPHPDTLLTLADGQQDDLGCVTVPAADQIVAGRIITDAGAVPDGVFATLTGAHTNETVSWDTDGRFRVFHVVAEPLTLTVSGNFAIAPNSSTTRVIQILPVQAGRQDVQVVIPAKALPPSQLPPAPAPVGPPRVVPTDGFVPLASLFLHYEPRDYAPDPQKDTFTVTLGDWGKVFWQGDLSVMDGMRLDVARSRGTLKDRAGRVLWSGLVREPAAYTVTTSPGPSPTARIQDVRGRTLWAGPVTVQGPVVTYVDGDIAAVGPDGRIAWEQTQTPGPVDYRSGPRGVDVVSGWPPPFPDGGIAFSIAVYHVVFQDGGGHVLYSGDLPTLSLTGSRHGKPAPPGDGLWLPNTILPYTVTQVRGHVQYTLSEAQGRTVEKASWDIN